MSREERCIRRAIQSSGALQRSFLDILRITYPQGRPFLMKVDSKCH